MDFPNMQMYSIIIMKGKPSWINLLLVLLLKRETYWYLIEDIIVWNWLNICSLDLNYVFRVRRNANKEIKTCITEDVELHRKFGAAVWKGIEGLPKTRLLRFRKNDSTYVLLTNLDGNVYNDDSI